MPARNAGVCSASQSITHAPERPGVSPRRCPGRVGSALTNEVIHGFDRVQPASSSTQRTDRARVSSMPSTRVGSGSGSHWLASAMSARCAVDHATWYSLATSLTARLPDAIAEPIFSRSRVVSRDRAGTARDCCVNVAVPQAGSRHTKRRLSHHRSVLWPEADKSLTRTSGRSLILEVSTPHSGQAPSGSMTSMTTRTVSASIRSSCRTVNSSSSPSSTDVPSFMLVASLLSRCERPTACRGHEPHQLPGTPLKREEPLSPVGPSHSSGRWLRRCQSRPRRRHRTPGMEISPNRSCTLMSASTGVVPKRRGRSVR